MLRKLTPEKTKVAEAMIFCIEHAEAYEEIIDFITESLNSVKTSIPKKVWRCIYFDCENVFNKTCFCFLVGKVFSRLGRPLQFICQGGQRFQLPFWVPVENGGNC